MPSPGPQLTLSTELGDEAFDLYSIAGTETLSELFVFQLELASENPNVAFERLVGKPATVTIARPGTKEAPKFIHGVIARAVQGEIKDGLTLYTAELRPSLWLLQFSRDSRIFQHQSVPDILETVFGDLGFSDFRNSLTRQYATREYTVQYNETYFELVSRLMEEEGIFYFFEHSEQADTLVLADDASAYPAVDLGEGQETLSVEADNIDECRIEACFTSTKYSTDDYSFEAPDAPLLVTNGGGELAATVYEYPGVYVKKDVGEARAKVRLEELQQAGVRLSGSGWYFGFSPGYKFRFSEHPRSDANTEYALHTVQHVATENSYDNSFEARPVDIAFRPPRRTPRPRIHGTQTAVVVGKQGEEIWTDKYGRIKVKFHWDQSDEFNENASCWIRVAHSWAGKGWGSIFIPRMGQEVVVSFLEGDPDRPLVTGIVYNADQAVPYDLPDHGTVSTIMSNSSKGGGGANELRFEDKKDSEEIFLHAQKDLNVEVENDRTIKVKEGNETHEVAGERSVTVTKDETHTSSASFTHEVSKDYTLKVEGNLTIDVAGDLVVKAKSVSAEAETSYSAKAGQAFDNEAGTALTNKAGTALTNKAGTALTNEAGTALTNKAGTTLNNEAQISLTNKASASLTNKSQGSMSSEAMAMHDVKSSGLLSLSGSLVKVG